MVVCGDRYWTDADAIERRLRLLPREVRIITGGAPGADTLAHHIAKRLGFDTRVIPANWRQFGRAAGPIRNRQMLNFNPELVIAFHADLRRSTGTIDCVTEARKRKLVVEVHG